jgi:hypothetical protein
VLLLRQRQAAQEQRVPSANGACATPLPQRPRRHRHQQQVQQEEAQRQPHPLAQHRCVRTAAVVAARRLQPVPVQ